MWWSQGKKLWKTSGKLVGSKTNWKLDPLANHQGLLWAAVRRLNAILSYFSTDPLHLILYELYIFFHFNLQQKFTDENNWLLL